MYFDTYDIACAWYIYLSQWHSGQWSIEYRRLSKLTKWFTPPMMLNNEDSLNENARVIYDNIVDRFQ